MKNNIFVECPDGEPIRECMLEQIMQLFDSLPEKRWFSGNGCFVVGVDDGSGRNLVFSKVEDSRLFFLNHFFGEPESYVATSGQQVSNLKGLVTIGGEDLLVPMHLLIDDHVAKECITYFCSTGDRNPAYFWVPMWLQDGLSSPADE